MIVSTIASTRGTHSATTMPARQPSEMKLTSSTMASASTKVSMNSDTECSTTFAWSAIWVTSMPTGSVWMIASIATLRSSPSLMMLEPSCIDTPRPIAGLPPSRTRKVAGSS